jgi:N-acetylglucosamine-6-phosphate deacetylase
MQGDSAIRTVLQTHARHGTAALLATSVTAPCDAIDEFLDSVARVMCDQAAGDDGQPCSALLGAHLEGPFINPGKLGAQPDYPIPLDLARLESWFRTGVVKVITYAPELDDGQQVPALCSRYGVRAQIGHTLCSWATATAALAAGAGVTHLYNAMSPVLHRDGGAAVAALAYATHAEIITDGVHVDRAAFDAARRAIGGLYSVTDATAAAGMPDGPYQLGSLTIEKLGNHVVLPDGTLAGSCLTQQRSIQVLRAWGLDWDVIAQISSAIPSQWLNQADLGVIATGARACWLEIADGVVTALWQDGQRHTLDPLP